MAPSRQFLMILCTKNITRCCTQDKGPGGGAAPLQSPVGILGKAKTDQVARKTSKTWGKMRW
ncbi:hypothetical protein BKA80DRAFT_267743 [Phyllosticta citrichinensis]